MSKYSPRTQAIHAGEAPEGKVLPVAPPLHMANSYLVDAGDPFSAEGLDADAPYIYGRWSNPTIKRLERRIAALEEAEGAACFASGMAAITALFTHVLGAGDHLVMSDVAYAGAVEYTRDLLPHLGVSVTPVDASDNEAVARAIQPNTRLIHVETPCNPILRLADLSTLSSIAHEHDVLLSVDSTFASPEITKPLEYGADFVMHSLTKYFGGHGDALGGVIAGNTSAVEALRARVGVHAGGVLSPFNAWLILRGIATLPLRMRAHSESAMAVARFLEGHPRVERVVYPGLPSHPQHELACRQMRQFSGIVSFQANGGVALAKQLQERMGLISYAVSLGDVRSLLFYIDTDEIVDSSFGLQGAALSAYREWAGDGVFRVSVGLEDPDDLCQDLDQALSKL